MSGSRIWLRYVTDANAAFAVFLDKSNHENTALGFQRVPSGANLVQLPRGVKMRYALTYQADVPSRKRKFYIATIDAYNARYTNRIISAPIIGGESPVNWIITALRGEKMRLPFSGETGLNDGTN